MIPFAQWLKRGAKKKVRKPLRKMSRKRQREARIYTEKRRAFLQAHPYCQAYPKIQFHLTGYAHPSDSMAKDSVDIHHMKKPRAKYLNDESTWLAVCRWSHDWIENNKSTARFLGLLE